MTDRPILFSGSMVRSLIAECKKPGHGKTQTRRYMNPQPYVNGYAYSDVLHEIACHNDWLPPSAMLLDVWKGRAKFTISDAEGWQEHLPYLVGDSLWVRETWADDEQFGGVLYRADNPDADPIGNGWRPSIFMPRKYSRLTLSVTDVRVQRLQDISDADAWAEGVTLESLPRYEGQGIHLFRDLWDSINGKRPGRAWSDNPWIVAVTFMPELRNIDAPVREIAA